jgi:hypothetical protein
MTMVLPFLSAAQARLAQIALPAHLAAKLPDRALGVCLREQLQAGLDGSPFGASSAASHGLAHQAVVDVNVRAHIDYV